MPAVLSKSRIGGAVSRQVDKQTVTDYKLRLHRNAIRCE